MLLWAECFSYEKPFLLLLIPRQFRTVDAVYDTKDALQHTYELATELDTELDTDMYYFLGFFLFCLMKDMIHVIMVVSLGMCWYSSKG